MSAIWTPGAAGPLDELVSRVSRLASEFAQEHDLKQAQVCVELVDGSRHTLATSSAEPGFGFFSFTPHHEEGDAARRLIVPVGAVRSIEISTPDPERPHLGFAVDE